MLPNRSRVAAAAAIMSISLAAAGLTAPIVAADSPETAVNQLLDAVEAGDYEAIESLVAEDQRDSVREMLDPSEAMGVGGDAFGEALTFKVEDRELEVLSQDDEEATVLLTGTMSMIVDEEKIPEVARALVEADMGEDASDEDIELMLPFIEMAFSQTSPLNEELTLIVENDEWVISGGFGEAPVDTAPVDDFVEVTDVQPEGVCGFVTPEELTAVGPLEYGSSGGFELKSCTYSSSDPDVYHSTTVTVELDTDAEYAASAYGADQETEVAGARAFTAGEGGYGLFVQVGLDMLNVSIFAIEPPYEGYLELEQSVAIAELFVPQVAARRDELILPVPPLLCDLTFAADFEAVTGLPLHSGNVNAEYCNFESYEHARINTSMRPGTLEEQLQYFPDSTELTVLGLPAVEIDDEYNESAVEIRVELPSEQMLYVTIEPANIDRPLDLPALEIVEALTEHILARQAE